MGAKRATLPSTGSLREPARRPGQASRLMDGQLKFRRYAHNGIEKGTGVYELHAKLASSFYSAIDGYTGYVVYA
jgi:hypothetical protein